MKVHILKKCGEGWSPDQEKKIPCDQCSKMFQNESSLSSHFIAKHSHDVDIKPRGFNFFFFFFFFFFLFLSFLFLFFFFFK